MDREEITFVQQNSPDGGFLQSSEWRKFQESVGRKTYNVSFPHPASGHPLPQAGEGDIFFHASIIEHMLPIVGKYFYIPRGPVVNDQRSMIRDQLRDLIDLAKNNNIGWIRVEPATNEILEAIESNTTCKIKKAPHDMQPRELFIINVTKPEEQLLAEMKSKTRYNIKVAQKHGVAVTSEQGTTNNNLIENFLKLTQIMAKRQGIEAHPESYYRKMLEVIPKNILKLYIAEYNNQIIAANIVIFYGKTCTYLHGASDDEYRNVMAPFLLQWQQIQDAKVAGCERYDFGGISTNYLPRRQAGESSMNVRITNKWAGITRFKLGFSPNTRPTEFPGSYDIIINSRKYWLYRNIQRLKNLIK
ncbi:MAG: peptidoglycan bridge formation glycyltransferase FemA/FemB family protein [Parcubacteria group bacterium]|jgi:lipid II:glycine glycyltransferase (peptidoglycan interpeptide bridge formation enzyme)